jgi:DNA polymerase-3 subunit delta'
MENELLDLVGERGTITIDQIRQPHEKPRIVPPPLLQEAFTKPHLSERKVFILDYADRMTAEAANAMLHLLEEPPPQVVIILVSSRPSMLLPTIVSRCRPLRFSPASQKRVEEVLLSLGAEEAKARSIAVLSAGRVGWAISALSSDGLMELRSSVLDIFEQLCETETPEALLWSERFKQLALSFLDEQGATSKEPAAPARDQGEPERSRGPDLRRDQKLRLMLPYMLEIGATWLRDALVLEACPASADERENLINPDRKQGADRVARLLDHASINACLEGVSTAAARLTRNANADLVLDSLAIRLIARFSSARPATQPAGARRQG